MSEHRLDKRVLTLSILILVSLIASTLPITHAQPTYSDNIVGNGDFETIRAGTTDQPAIWTTEFLDSNAGSTISLNSTQALLGIYSARLDVSQDTHSAKNPSQTIGFGHQTLRQQFPANFLVSNLTARPDSINLWYMIQPKFAGYSGLDVRIKAGDTTEMNYIFTNPQTGISASNSSTGGEAGKPVKYIVIPTPNMNRWAHLSRNMAQDWLAPMTNSSGVMPGRFATDQTIVFIEIWSFYYQDPFSLAVYGETEWVDNVAIYVDSTTPPPPPPPHNYYAAFNFIDSNGASVNNRVKWKLLNSTGSEMVGYAQNDPSLTLEPYFLEAYYPTLTGQNPEPFKILHEKIPLNTTSTIPLQMYPQTLVPGGYVAFNNTVASFTFLRQDSLAFNFTATRGSTRPYLIVADATRSPLFVTLNNTALSQGTQWTYDQTHSVIRIETSDLGVLAIVFKASINWARFGFTDINSNPVDSRIVWQLYNASGIVPYTQGQVSLRDEQAYTLRVYYPTSASQTYLIHAQRIPLNVTTNIQLAMFPESSTPNGYITFNNTIASVSITTQDTNQANFTATTSLNSPYTIILNVPRKVLSVQRNSMMLSEGTDWSYDPANSAVRIITGQLGTFFLDFRPTYNYPVVSFQDVQGTNMNPNLTIKFLDSQGNIVNNSGTPLPQDAYTLFAYFEGYLLYKQSLTPSSSSTVQLSMIPIGTTQRRYIAINTTVSSLAVLEDSSSRLQFTAVGQRSALIIVSASSKPLSVQLNGNNVTSWTYNSTTSTIAIQASQLGTFTIIYSSIPPIPVLIYVGAIIGAAAIATAGLLVWRRTRSRNPNQSTPVEGSSGTKEQPGSKTKTPQKGQRGRS